MGAHSPIKLGAGCGGRGADTMASLRRQLLNLFVHEPLSVTMVHARRAFSWAKNIMPRLNKALPPRLKRFAFKEYTEERLPPGLAPLAAFEVHSKRVARLLAGNPGSFTLHGTNCYVVGTGPRRVLPATPDTVCHWEMDASSSLSAAMDAFA